jgi:hypothetical protein
VQDDVVIGGVTVVPVCFPVCRTHVDFDIPSGDNSVDSDDGIQKIRAGFIAGTARVEDTYGPVIDGLKQSVTLVQPFPQFDNAGFG